MVTEQLQPGRVRVPPPEIGRSSELQFSTSTPRTPQPRTPGTSGVVADAYFAELLGHPLERLAKEPELLREDQKQLRRQTQDSGVLHYRAFLATAESAAAAAAEAASAVRQLDALAEDLPALGAEAAAFSDRAAALLLKRSRNKQLQSAQGPLQDVLEAPALIDTCVRNGHFDEALDLRAFVGTLAFAHGDVLAVAALAAETDAAAAALLEALLGRLRGQVQLPECLRVVGYLRRLAVFDEQELRAQFLACREAHLTGLVADIEGAGTAYETLRRLTDVHRVHLFDAVMQYRAVFSDDAPQESARPGGQSASGGGDSGLLCAWAERRITLYLEALRALLPQVGDGGMLGQALEHCMYTGSALGRVGLDFRPALPPLFESRILSLFTQTVANAVETFAATLETHRWLPTSAASRARRPAQDGEAKAGAPPYALMEAPPLAVFANGIAAALNELRHCPPLVLRGPVTGVLQDALAGMMAALADYGESRSLNASEKPLFVSAAQAAVKVLAPYVAACLQRVYPGAGPPLQLASACAPIQELLAQWAPPQQPTPQKAAPAGAPATPAAAAVRPPPSTAGSGAASPPPSAAPKPG